MATSLNIGEIALINQSLEYTKKAYRESQSTPYKIKQDNLNQVEVLKAKLSLMVKELSGK